MSRFPEKTSAAFRSGFDAVLTYGRMIRFSHTLFALPFALSAVVLARRVDAITAGDLLWILAAMVGARSAAMGFNRIIDAGFDRDNPRTAGREIPAGRISIQSAAVFVILSSILFVVAAAMLNPLCLALSVPVLVVLFGYSYTKRFTRWSHLYLGFAISLAPMGAWIALTGVFSWGILMLSLALMTYIAGFDIIYACQDVDFDQNRNLFSVPAHYGVPTSLRLAAGLHVISFCFFVGLYFYFNMGWIYLITAAVIGGLFVVEHRLVRGGDLKHIELAFFHVNSVISVMLFAGVLADEWVMRWMS